MFSSNFDSIAPYYDWLCRRVFGHNLYTAQIYWLQTLPKQQTVLIIGGGTGQIAIAVGQYCNPSAIWYVEPSEPMLQRCRERLANSPFEAIVHYIHGTEEAIPSSLQCDIILTPFVLDLFHNQVLVPMLGRLARHHSPQGLWVHTDFFPTKQYWSRTLLWLMYQFFRRISKVQAQQLPDYGKAFAQQGYQLSQEKSFLQGFVKSQVWHHV